MNSYPLVFDEPTTGRDTLVSAIDRIPEIANWMFFFDNAACVVSDLSAKELPNLVRRQLPAGHFIIVALDRGKRGGWLRKSVWDFVQDPKPVSG